MIPEPAQDSGERGMSEERLIPRLAAARWALLGLAIGLVPGSVVAMWFYVGSSNTAHWTYRDVPAVACLTSPFIAVLALICHKWMRLEEWRVRLNTLCDPADNCRICAQLSEQRRV